MCSSSWVRFARRVAASSREDVSSPTQVGGAIENQPKTCANIGEQLEFASQFHPWWDIEIGHTGD